MLGELAGPVDDTRDATSAYERLTHTHEAAHTDRTPCVYLICGGGHVSSYQCTLTREQYMAHSNAEQAS